MSVDATPTEQWKSDIERVVILQEPDGLLPRIGARLFLLRPFVYRKFVPSLGHVPVLGRIRMWILHRIYHRLAMALSPPAHEMEIVPLDFYYEHFDVLPCSHCGEMHAGEEFLERGLFGVYYTTPRIESI